jgi:hypothetical protein
MNTFPPPQPPVSTASRLTPAARALVLSGLVTPVVAGIALLLNDSGRMVEIATAGWIALILATLALCRERPLAPLLVALVVPPVTTFGGIVGALIIAPFCLGACEPGNPGLGALVIGIAVVAPFALGALVQSRRPSVENGAPVP